MGVEGFLTQRQPLANGQLNLGAWHGFNEVYFKSILDLRRLQFEAKIMPDAYLWILLGQPIRDRVAIRLSRNPFYPSGIYRLEPSGRYTLLSQMPSQYSGNSMSVEVLPKSEGFLDWSLNVNGESIAHFSLDGTNSFVGFRSGQFSANLTKVEILTPNARFQDSFAPQLSWVAMVKIFGILILGGFLLSRFGIGNFSLVTGYVGILALVVAGALWGFDWFYYSERYYYSGFTPEGWQKSAVTDQIEKWRTKGMRELAKLLDPSIVDIGLIWGHGDFGAIFSQIDMESTLVKITDYQFVHPNGDVDSLNRIDHSLVRDNRPKFLFIGTSQFWGAGAVSSRHTWMSKFVQRYNQRLGTNDSALNLSKCGVNTEEILPEVDEALKVFTPSVVIFNLGSNDRGLPEAQLRARLASTMTVLKSKGAAVFLSLEPESFEWGGAAPENVFSILSELGGQFAAPVINSYAYFQNPDVRDSGFLFWDMIHFDNWGHEVFANYLVDQVADPAWIKLKSASQ